MQIYCSGSLEEASAAVAINLPLIKFSYNPPQEKIDEAARFEIWGTSFSDQGDDYTELYLFDENDNKIYTERCNGY